MSIHITRLDFARVFTAWMAAFYLLFGTGAANSIAHAAAEPDSPPVQELRTLSMRELLNVSVLSATSKREESFIESPGIVSRVTKQDIAEMGANNLHDLLRRLPNVETPSLYLFRNNVTSVRGQQAVTDTHVLILLNGRPMRETYNGGVNQPIYEGFPLTSIKWIEVIRGPGSVLHGSGAFSAVVNIVTQEASEQASMDAAVSYGSFNTKILDASGSGKVGEVALTGGIKFFGMDGWEYETKDSAGVDDSMDYGQENWAGTFQAKFKGFSFDFFESHTESDTLGTEPLWPADKAKLVRRFINAGYDHQINPRWRIDLDLTYNSFDAETGGPDNFNGNEDLLLEFTTYGDPVKSVNLIFGGVVEQLSWYRDNVPKDDGVEYAGRAYGEVVYRPLDGIRLAAGVQYNKAPNVDGNFSPRLAATFKFLDHWGAKLLYGEAFRAAVQIERFANIPGVFEGNPDLDPETMQTFDAQVFYYNEDLYAAITYYRSLEKDTINLDFSDVPITYVNSNKIDYQGIEFEFKWDATRQLSLQGSYAYQFDMYDDDMPQGPKVTPRQMAKLGVAWDTEIGITLGVFDSWFDAYEERESPSVLNPENSDYHHLSANLVFSLNTLFNYESKLHSKISLYGDNLLESDPLYAPDLAREELNTLPIRPGRAVYLRYHMEIP